MEMNSPIGSNALDTPGIVGKPVDRVDGRLKVTGGARYAYEMQQDNVLYGFVVEASIGKGTIRSIDTRAAEKAPGVILVLTHRNAPAQGIGNHREAHPVLTGPQVTRYGQPVAFVVAESFEQARAAAYHGAPCHACDVGWRSGDPAHREPDAQPGSEGHRDNAENSR